MTREEAGMMGEEASVTREVMGMTLSCGRKGVGVALAQLARRGSDPADSRLQADKLNC
jgi:hypothetical protein